MPPKKRHVVRLFPHAPCAHTGGVKHAAAPSRVLPRTPGLQILQPSMDIRQLKQIPKPCPDPQNPSAPPKTSGQIQAVPPQPPSRSKQALRGLKSSSRPLSVMKLSARPSSQSGSGPRAPPRPSEGGSFDCEWILPAIWSVIELISSRISHLYNYMSLPQYSSSSIVPFGPCGMEVHTQINPRTLGGDLLLGRREVQPHHGARGIDLARVARPWYRSSKEGELSPDAMHLCRA